MRLIELCTVLVVGWSWLLGASWTEASPPVLVSSSCSSPWRCLGLWADGIGVVLPGLTLVTSRPDRKRLGDMLARTVVVVSE